MKTHLTKLLLVPALLALFATLASPLATASAQSTAFTYQGRVTDNGTNFDGMGQFKFALVTSTNTSSQATATAVMTYDGAGHYYVSSFNVTAGGGGYLSAPRVMVAGKGSSAATAHANIVGGEVTGVVPDDGGSYPSSTPPLVTIAPPPPAITYTTYWSNDGTSDGEPTAVVTVTVNSGLFTVVLGDTNTANMSVIDAALFSQPNLQLRIWFSDGVNNFAALDPAQPLTPAPYAVNALTATSANGLPGLTVQQNAGDMPNIIGGSSANGVAGGVGGATIGGGGVFDHGNGVGTSFSTVSGGIGNTAGGGDYAATVGGGWENAAIGGYSTVGGGYENKIYGFSVTIGGGNNGHATGDYATIGGGSFNQATNDYSTVPGGRNNVAGGQYSFAAGYNAQATNDGTFVWADSQPADFASTAADQFLIRAQGGVGINNNQPGTVLDVQGNGTDSGGVSGYGEVVARFKNTGAGTHTAMSIDSLAGQSSILYLAEGGAAKWDLRRDGNPGGNEAFEMRWHGNGGNSSQLTLTTNGNLSVTGGLRLNDKPVYLRTGGDVNHGLGYNGGTITNFGTGQYQIDGPALWGYSGGLLGTKNGGDYAELTWNSTSVNIGFTNDTMTAPPALGVIGNRYHGYPLAYVHNVYPPGILQSGPALRVVNDGDSPDGALSVSVNVPANTSGNYIAEFGNSSSYVVQIGVDGTVYSKGLALTSDRNAKEDFAPVSAQTVLAKVAALPITEWNYKTDAAGQKHLGPMAQDFHAAFDLNGTDDKHISVIDEGGVALAAIQGLNEKLEQKLEQKQTEITELKARLDKLESLVLTKAGGVK